jgi:hypothetical protein
MNVSHHFTLDTTVDVFTDHEDGDNELLIDDDHRTKRIKCTANRYFMLRLFTFGKKYIEQIVNKSKQSDRYGLNKLILFNNQ